MISVVIPTFNDDCVELSRALAAQASAIEGFEWEVVVADDGSTDVETVAHNEAINLMPHCRYLRRKVNVGRARIRNVLAQEARGEWLLFIDGDARIIVDDYLQRFLEASKHAAVCYGGYRMMPGPANNLRWQYERSAAQSHTVERRREQPYQSFKICNLLIRRDLMLAHPLDNRYTRYGYEDVMMGRQLREAGVAVEHIDAPVGFFKYDDNARFVAKTEEGLHTLYEFRKDLEGYSALLDASLRMNGTVKAGFWLLYRALGPMWRRNLVGRNPKLWLFKMYKMGYFLNLSRRAAGPRD